jgi:hypothetical protein
VHLADMGADGARRSWVPSGRVETRRIGMRRPGCVSRNLQICSSSAATLEILQRVVRIYTWSTTPVLVSSAPRRRVRSPRRSSSSTPILDSYATIREHVKQVLAEALHAGDDPAVVARVVLKAATSRTPKVRYPAGPLARRLSLLKRFAPAALLDNGIRKANKLTKAPKPAVTSKTQVPQKVW